MSELVKAGPLAPIKSVVNDPAIRKAFDDVLGKKAPGFLSSIVSCVSGNDMLQKADPISVVRAASIAAALDLPVVPGLGFAFIVPYKLKSGVTVGTFQLGWKGYVQLAQRSEHYLKMRAVTVREGEIKNFNRFTGDFEFQEPTNTENVVGYMFFARTVRGDVYHYMTREECDAHGKRFSQSYKKGYGLWKDDFESMALKTVTKQYLSKWGVLSLDLQKALTYDGAEILDIESGEHRYPDNGDDPVTAESSAKRVEEIKAERADFIPELKPERTAQQFYDEVIAMPGGFDLVKTTVKNLRDAKHDRHADQLQALLDEAGKA